MRRAMICVSFMLAILQLWPMVFGQKSGGAANAAQSEPRFVAAAQAAPRSVAAVARRDMTPIPVKARATDAPMPSCYHLYEKAFARCGPGGAACQLKAGDAWDVCEATGFWPQ